MNTEPEILETKIAGTPKPFLPPQIRARLEAQKKTIVAKPKPVERASGADDRKLVIGLAVLGFGAYLYHRHIQSEKKEARRQELAAGRAERRALALAQLAAAQRAPAPEESE